MVRTRRSPADDHDEDDKKMNVDEEIDNGRKDLPPKNNESMRRKVLIAKDDSFSNGADLYSIRHPRLNSPTLFRLSSTSCDEVLILDDDYRCFFWGDSLISDGRPRIFSPYHPLFLALPYLEKKKARYEALEEILIDTDLPSIEHLMKNEQMMNEIKLIADVTDVGDEQLYKFNEKKTMEWIKGRFSILRDSLVAHSRLHDSITSNDEVLDRYTFGVLCDHLSTSLSTLAKAHLEIKDAPVVQSAPEPVGMKRKMDDDENLYSRMDKPPVKKTPTQTTAQKKLQQASKGTKSLASFFGKKAN